MKKLRLLPSAVLAANLLLCAVYCDAQTLGYGLTGIINTDTTTSIDTVKVVLLVGDTSHHFETYFETKPCKDTTNKFYLCGEEVKKDKGNYGYGQSYWVYGYSVRRKECCINGNTGNLAYYQPIPYYTHLLYLDDKKQPLKSTVIVWQSVSAK